MDIGGIIRPIARAGNVNQAREFHAADRQLEHPGEK
jgi:hypothetical protein